MVPGFKKKRDKSGPREEDCLNRSECLGIERPVHGTALLPPSNRLESLEQAVIVMVGVGQGRVG